MEPRQSQLIYEFDGFQLDARRRLLYSHADGQPVEMTARVFDTLLYLVERPGEVLDKRALMEALWPNVVVEESNLTQTIHTLRRALGERPGEHRFIVTVPGRGYRFVADVSKRLDAGAAGSPAGPASAAGMVRSRRAKLIASVVLGVGVLGVVVIAAHQYRESRAAKSAPTIQSIAVLPFVDMSPSGDSAYFADGLSEELLNLLAQIPDLRVIARTSSFSFRDQNVDIATIAEKLAVGHVLEGSVRKSGNKVRITAQLVEASSSAHLWSQTYERDLDDIFAVQSEIAAAVADALQAKMASGVQPTLAPPINTQAYEHFLRGQFFFGRRAPGDLDKALNSYQAALAIDPKYARAWAGVAAVSFVQTGDDLVPRNVALARLLEAAQRTIALDPQLAEGHLRLAGYYWRTGQREVAGQHYRRGAALNPDSPLVLGSLAGAAAEKGQLDEAIALQRRAAALDPLSAVNIGNLGIYLFTAGRLEEARTELSKAYELNPDSDIAVTVGQILILQGNLKAALSFIEQSAKGADLEQDLALVYHALGRTDDADAALKRLIAESGASDPFPIAEVYAYRGNPEEAFRWLEKSAQAFDPGNGSPMGKHFPWEMRASPLLASLHSDPRWETWVARLPLDWEGI